VLLDYAKYDRERAAESARANFRRRRFDEGTFACDVCEWSPPAVIMAMGVPRVLQAHHIVAVSAGGHDTDENLLLLCPNHHAIAGALRRKFTQRDALLEALRRSTEHADA